MIFRGGLIIINKATFENYHKRKEGVGGKEVLFIKILVKSNLAKS